MNNSLSNKERIILLVIFSGLILIYNMFGLFESAINPLIKLLLFIAIGIYIFIKSNLKIKSKEVAVCKKSD